MAIEKTLNTRILMKVDTLENWGKSTLPLKKGELAFATVAASAGTGLTDPVVMVKIGEDGVKTFKDLDWNFYAKASDVLAACKSETTLKAFINGVIADAGIATNEAMEALAKKVTDAEGEIDALQAELDAEETGLKARMTTAEGAIDALEGLVGDKKVALQIEEAITALNLATTYEAKGAAEAVRGELNTYKTSNDAKILEHTNAISANTNAIAGIKDSEAIDSFADVETALAGKEVAGAAAQALADAKAYANGLAGNYDESGAAATAESNAKAYAKEYADGLASNYDASGSAAQALIDAKAYTDGEIDAWVGDKKVGVQISEAISGLDLPNTYDAKGAAAAVDGKLTTHASEAAATYETKTDAAAKLAEGKEYTDAEVAKVQGEVDALEALVGTLPEDADATTVVAYIDAKTTGIASDATVTGIDNRVKAIEEDYLKNADKEELAEDIADVAALIGGTEVSVQIENAIKTEKERAEGIEAGLRTDVDAIKDDYLKTADKEALQGQIDLIMNNPDTEKVINSISEFTQYIEDHGEIAEGMRTDINKNKEDIAAEIERATGVEGGLDTRLAAVEDAVGESGSVAGDIADALAEAKGYTDAEVKELAEGAVATNAAAISALETKVGDKTVAAQIEAAIEALKIGDYAKAADLTAAINQHNTDKAALEASIATKANDADLAVIAKTGSTDDLVQGNLVLVFDCGTSV